MVVPAGPPTLLHAYHPFVKYQPPPTHHCAQLSFHARQRFDRSCDPSSHRPKHGGVKARDVCSQMRNTPRGIFSPIQGSLRALMPLSYQPAAVFISAVPWGT